MRILQVITTLNTGGAEKLIVDSVPFYQSKGIDVDVLILNDKDSPFREQLAQKTNGKIFGLTKGSVYNPLLVFKIIPFLKNYDLIHGHLFPVLYWIVFAKFIRFSSIPIVYTEHSTSNRRRKIKFLSFLDRFVYKKIDTIVTISKDVDHSIKEHLSDNYNFKLINNGVDIDIIANSKAYEKATFFEDGDVILIQVSSFRWQKDQKTLINSLVELPENVKLLLVGEGDTMVDCKGLVSQLGLESRVIFLGLRFDIPQLLKTSDIIILSSLHEGLSLANIEGMAALKPFIGSEVPGIKDIVEGYGLLFKQGDYVDLANKIKMLIGHKEFYEEIASKCLQRAQEFSLEIMVDQYIVLYKSIIK